MSNEKKTNNISQKKHGIGNESYKNISQLKPTKTPTPVKNEKKEK